MPDLQIVNGQPSSGTDLGALASSLNGKTMDNKTYQKGELKLLDESEKVRKEGNEIPLAKPPVMAPAPDQKDYATNPMQSFGSFAMVLATLGSAMTKHPLTNALNAGAAVLNAKNAGDAAAYKSAMDKWKIDSDNSWKMADWEQKNFEDMRQRNKDDAEGLNRDAEIWAAMTKNPALDAAAKAGQVQEYMDNHAKAVEQMNDARELKVEKNGVYQGKLDEWLEKNKNPDGTTKSVMEIPKGVVSKLHLDSDNEWKQAQEGKLGVAAGELTPEQYEQYRNDPAMKLALNAYKISGNPRTALGGGTMGGKALQPKIQALQRMAIEDNPNFNPAIVSMMAQGYQKELNAVQTQSAKIGLASDILDSSIPSLIEASKKLGLSQSASWNDMVNAARKQFNSDDFKNFQTQLRAVATDYAQFIGRGQGTVHSDEESLKILNENQNTSSLKGFQDAVTTERDNVSKGIDEKLQEIQGKMSGNSSKESSGGGDNRPSATDKNGNKIYWNGKEWGK